MKNLMLGVLVTLMLTPHATARELLPFEKAEPQGAQQAVQSKAPHKLTPNETATREVIVKGKLGKKTVNLMVPVTLHYEGDHELVYIAPGAPKCPSGWVDMQGDVPIVVAGKKARLVFTRCTPLKKASGVLSRWVWGADMANQPQGVRGVEIDAFGINRTAFSVSVPAKYDKSREGYIPAW